MYQIGDVVMYRGTGVCKITDIVKQKFMRDEEKTYYVLRGVYDTTDTTIYCPIDKESEHLRGLYTEAALREIIHTAPDRPSVWVENATLRKKNFSALLKEDDPITVLRMLMDIYRQKEQKESVGKRLHVNDERILQEAGRAWHQEIACSLGISPDDAVSFVERELGIVKA